MRSIAIILIVLFLPFSAFAVCSPGYYDNNGACRRCVNGYYCPGDGTMVQCPPNPFTPAEIMEHYGVDLDSATNQIYVSSRTSTDYPDNISECHISFDGARIQGGGCVFYRVLYEWNTQTQQYQEVTYGRNYYVGADAGYYMSQRLSNNAYVNCNECTNLIPTNSHYSGPGTPEVGNCPWECDSGYGRHGNSCLPLCTAGITKIHVGNDVSFNVYRDKITTPSINVMVAGGTVCHVCVETGLGRFNISDGTSIWHATD